MDDPFWEEYASNADENYNEEFAKFIRDLATSLKCTSVLEVGCNAGNDLRLFPESIKVNGLDSNQKIVNVAKTRLPTADFRAGMVTELPYDDASIDMIFTHGFFNHLEDEKIDAGIRELFRVSAKYIVNCEALHDDAGLTGHRGRDMYKKWQEYKVRIISNVVMHEDIDPLKPAFVLVRKL